MTVSEKIYDVIRGQHVTNKKRAIIYRRDAGYFN